MITNEQVHFNDLLAQVCRQNQDAFRQLYAAVAPKLLAVLLKMLHDRQIAEDALQDTMMNIWNTASTFDPERGKATTWMISIARYRALDRLRKMGRYREVLNEDKNDIIDVLNSDSENIEPLSDVTVSRLEDCLGKLNQDVSKSIQYSYISGYSASEIAKKIDRPLGTVKSWIRRGLSSLRECFQA